MWRDVPAYHGASLDHGALSDPHIRQDDAVGANEDISFDNDFAFCFAASGTKIQVGKNGSPQPDAGVVSNGNAGGMTVVNVDEVRKPYISANVNSAETMHPRPQAASSRTDKSDHMKRRLNRFRIISPFPSLNTCAELLDRDLVCSEASKLNIKGAAAPKIS